MALFSLTVTSGDVASTLTDYPAYIDLAQMPAGFWSVVANGGGDIRCYSDEAKTTELAREVVACDTSTDTGELHIKIPSLTTSTVIYIDVDGARSDYAVTDTYGRNAVWSDYAGVWHPGGGTDSTGNGRTLAGNGGVTIGGITGNIGTATDFDGSNDYVRVGSGIPSLSDFTMQKWINPDIYNREMYFFSTNYNADNSLIFFSELNSPHPLSAIIDGNLYTASFSAVLTTSTWQMLHLRRDGSSGSFLLDGTTVHTFTSTTQAIDTGVFEIGWAPTRNKAGVYLDGKVSEVRLRGSALSDNWITTEYNNQSDVTGFWTIAEITSTDYPLTAGIGAFTLTGIASLFHLSRLLTAVTGAFTLTGIATILSFGRKMLASAGSFVLTGIDTVLLFGKGMSAVVGSFILTGQTASLTSVRTMAVTVGTFTLTGIATAFSLGMKMVASVGTFTLTGIDVLLKLGKGLVASAGSFTLTGIDIAFDLSRGIRASVGSFILTGIDVILKPSNPWSNSSSKTDVSFSNTSKNDED